MFDALSNKLTDIFDRLRGRGRLSEADVDKVLREIRLALLDADVALPAVKALIEHVKEQALGQQLLQSITPSQLIVKIVYDAIVAFLGESAPLNTNANAPFSYLFVGLQGAGKTTTVAKVAQTLKNRLHLLLVSLDVYRPAAQEQLRILAENLGVPFFKGEEGDAPLTILKNAQTLAKRSNVDLILWDTAGRLQIDEAMMQKISEISTALHPVETLLVADALMGKEAIHVAKTFHERLTLTGLILTRMDGDMRGGAALSMKFATHCPIKFLGTGEGIDKLTPFEAPRIADQILDQGDVVRLVETAQSIAQESEVEKMNKRLAKGIFTLNDYMKQMQQMQKMGNASQVISMLPGAKKLTSSLNKNTQVLSEIDNNITKQIALIQSMTSKERRNPQLLNASRRRRIAAGAGQTVADLNWLLKQFEVLQDVFRAQAKNGPAGLLKMLQRLRPGGR